MSFGIGQPVPRTEDPRLLTGQGTYVDDISVPHMAYMAVVYTTVAHADIKSIDASGAIKAPGVITVLTIAVIAFVQEGQRRIPVQYGKRVRGTRVYGR